MSTSWCSCASCILLQLFLSGYTHLRCCVTCSANPKQKGCANLPWGLARFVLIQWAAGLINVILLAPIWMQILHLFLADILWILYVLLAANVLAVED
jgi:heme A synthase